VRPLARAKDGSTPDSPLLAASQDVFFFEGSGAEAYVTRNGKGEVTGFLASYGDRSVEARRVR
jgi:hypothetical protein